MNETEQIPPCPMCGATKTWTENGNDYWTHDIDCQLFLINIAGAMEMQRFLYAKFYADLMRMIKESFRRHVSVDYIRGVASPYAPPPAEQSEESTGKVKPYNEGGPALGLSEDKERIILYNHVTGEPVGSVKNGTQWAKKLKEQYDGRD